MRDEFEQKAAARAFNRLKAHALEHVLALFQGHFISRYPIKVRTALIDAERQSRPVLSQLVIFSPLPSFKRGIIIRESFPAHDKVRQWAELLKFFNIHGGFEVYQPINCLVRR
mmetsp:Transcript_11591/g.71303  ORF Transcript_11591/g.71303 Transcript_11591/m.71303 type:complete len:113 (+) Transcript_11591:582-920(+)